MLKEEKNVVYRQKIFDFTSYMIKYLIYSSQITINSFFWSIDLR